MRFRDYKEASQDFVGVIHWLNENDYYTRYAKSTECYVVRLADEMTEDEEGLGLPVDSALAVIDGNGKIKSKAKGLTDEALYRAVYFRKNVCILKEATRRNHKDIDFEKIVRNLTTDILSQEREVNDLTVNA